MNQIKNEKILQQLEELFSSDTVEHYNIRGLDYFNIVIKNRVHHESGIRCTSVGGYKLRKLDKIIDGRFHISSIDTTNFPNKSRMETEILIVEGVRN